MYSSRSWGADGLPPTSNRFLSEAREDKDTSSTLYTYTCIYIHWNEHNALLLVRTHMGVFRNNNL